MYSITDKGKERLQQLKEIIVDPDHPYGKSQ